jgi:apolipoprotein D and lipocalin family protein
MKKIIPLLSLLAGLVTGCVSVPKDVAVVEGFELKRYLGTWYEIARLDHSFERGLDNVSANYSLRDGGGVTVLNRGRTAKGKWKEAKGKAFFVGDPGIGRLKVSFFIPFYGAYNIIALDKQNYAWAMVCGPDKSYLWILSRTPALDETVKQQLTAQAKNAGFDTASLIWVQHMPRTK